MSESESEKTLTNIPIKQGTFQLITIIPNNNNSKFTHFIRIIIYLELNENINLISMEKLDPGSPEHWPEKSKYDNSTF